MASVNDFGLKLCKALGINSDHVNSITVNVKAGNLGTVTVQRFLTNEAGDRMNELITEEYNLEPKE